MHKKPFIFLSLCTKAARRGRKRKFARDLQPNFPPVLQVSGKHPIMYSANGSHGLWAAPGTTINRNLKPFQFTKTKFESIFQFRRQAHVFAFPAPRGFHRPRDCLEHLGEPHHHPVERYALPVSDACVRSVGRYRRPFFIINRVI